MSIDASRPPILSSQVHLTAIEKRLVASYRKATLFDLAPTLNTSNTSPDDLRAWNASHNIRALVLRDILLGTFDEGADPNPRGLRVRGARITGRLDLDLMTPAAGISFEFCLLTDGLSAEAADLPYLNIKHCVVDSLSAQQNQGALHLVDAKIEGSLDLGGSFIDSPTNVALYGDNMHIKGRCAINEGFQIATRSRMGGVRLVGAHLGAHLDASYARLVNTDGPGLIGNGLTCSGDIDINYSYVETSTLAGAVQLPGAHISGSLTINGSCFSNDKGQILGCEGVKVSGDVNLGNQFSGNSSGAGGAVALIGASIYGQFGLDDIHLFNDTGPVLDADMAVFRGGFFIQGGHFAAGDERRAAFNLHHIEVRGEFRVVGSEILNNEGSAIISSGMKVTGATFIGESLNVLGEGPKGVVDLKGAMFEGPVYLRGASVINASGLALDARGARVRGDLHLDANSAVDAPRGQTALALEYVEVGGRLHVSDTIIQSAAQGLYWAVTGLVYKDYPTADYGDWLTLLRHGTPTYSPQPYQQLASVARELGHDDQARKILIQQRIDYRRRGSITWARRVWSLILQVLLGYGYKSWRALIAVIVIAGISWLSVATHRAGLYQAGSKDPCTLIQQIQLAVDMAVPLIRTGVSSTCRVASNDAGQWISTIGVLTTMLGWAFTALFAAGLTRIIRQP
jgi:hypothetical protein